MFLLIGSIYTCREKSTTAIQANGCNDSLLLAQGVLSMAPGSMRSLKGSMRAAGYLLWACTCAVEVNRGSAIAFNGLRLGPQKRNKFDTCNGAVKGQIHHWCLLA